MRRFVLAPAAERDLREILRWTHEHFGEPARLRYEALVVQALRDLADDPERSGSAARPELAAGARVYHLSHSRRRVPPGVGTVRRPRHFVLYKVRDDHLEIDRVLHDSMDLAAHQPTPDE